jgi:lipopolysaccharide/colanic/teichoic acid biosynthesis glycosyltransferase
MYRTILKPALDVVLSLVAIIAAAPIMLATALVVRVTLGSPILFRQQRPGREGKPFTIFKFRTMRVSRGESDGARLTPMGQFLRSTSLDELPELINVLRGEMSLVGPRPLLMEYLPRYTATQARRHELAPGITGLAQVSGRNGLSWEQKFDVRYVEQLSLWLDLKILVMTVARVFRREGISPQGHATAPEFLGSKSRE